MDDYLITYRHNNGVIRTLVLTADTHTDAEVVARNFSYVSEVLMVESFNEISEF